MPLSIGHTVLDPFVLEYGRDYIPQKLPRTYRKPRADVLAQCFKNSYLTAMDHKDVTYVEVYAISFKENAGAFHRAWCADAVGRVIDRTWYPGVRYFGVPIKTEFLRRLMRERKRRLGKKIYYGLLTDLELDYPFLKKFAGKPEFGLHYLTPRLMAKSAHCQSRQCRRRMQVNRLSWNYAWDSDRRTFPSGAIYESAVIGRTLPANLKARTWEELDQTIESHSREGR